MGDPQDDELTMGCALFADDAVGVSPTIEAAALFCNIITEWTAKNEMAVGISKCGVLEMPVDPTGALELTEEHELRPSLQISGESVPIVNEYIYLGIRLTSQLSYPQMIKHRYKSGIATAEKLRPYLSSVALPMAMRLRVLQAVLLPKYLYGAELWGCNRSITNRIQKATNKSLRYILGLKTRRLEVSSVGLHREMGLKPICAIAAGRKMRAYKKCFQLKTFIGVLIRNPLRSRKWTWGSGCMRWMRRHCFRHATTPDLAPSVALWHGLPPPETRAFVEACIMERETNIRLRKEGEHGEVANAYILGNYPRERSLTRANVGGFALEQQGYALIVRCRIGAIATASRMADWGYLSHRHKDRCPFCRKRCGGETIYHMLIKCEAWRNQRRDLLGETLQNIQTALAERENDPNVNNGNDDQIALSWLLGGIHGGVGVQGWMPATPNVAGSEEYSSDSDSDDDAEPAYGGDAFNNNAGEESKQNSRDLARFLVTIMRLRSQKLRQKFNSRRTFDRRDLILAYTPGQRPDG
jgi:hypothetical protein